MVTREKKLAKCYNKRAVGSFYKSYSTVVLTLDRYRTCTSHKNNCCFDGSSRMKMIDKEESSIKSSIGKRCQLLLLTIYVAQLPYPDACHRRDY
jgi:hypothetical protein